MDGLFNPTPSASSIALEMATLPKSGRFPVPPVPSKVAEKPGTGTPALESVEPSPGLSSQSAQPSTPASKTKGVAVIVTLAGISFLNTMGSGILIAALPSIAREVGLPEHLILWPAAVYALAAGCLLLPLSAVADILGAKLLWVTGSFFFMVFTLGVGLARTGMQIILFRTFLGAAIAMCLPTAVGIITNTFPRGNWRNVAFAMNGMGQPLGYALGLVLGGIFTDTIGWRWAYYMMAIINGAISVSSIWSLQEVTHADPKGRGKGQRQGADVDWVGTAILSVAMGVLLYVLAMATSSYKQLGKAENATLLSVAFALLVAFPLWMRYQVKRDRPALIPNRLWRNPAFTSVCVSVFFCWAALNGIEYFTTLFFQNIQGLSPLQSSIRFLPHVIMGTAVNILVSYLVSRVKVSTLVVVSAAVTMIAPPLMATVKVDTVYWYAPFWAMLLSPANPDVLFTVSNLVISEAFPAEVQSLAGGVFNEVAQFGNSAGLAVMAAISASMTERSPSADHRAALMEGYRAAFWTIFAATAAVLVVSLVGLRKAGTVGKKEE